MIFSDIREFLPYPVKGKRIMGVDLGEKNVGIAFSDRNHMISSPYSVYKRCNIKKDLGYLNALFQERDCTAVIMGLPECTDVEGQEWMKKISAFAKKISEKYSINIYLQDETFSTKEAASALKCLSRSKIKKIDDKIAASCILRRTLDTMQRLCSDND